MSRDESVKVSRLVAGVAVVVVAVVGAAALNTLTDEDEPATAVPANDTQLVGIGRVVVAVPGSWDSNAASCNTPVRDTYFFPHPQDCVAGEAPSVSSVAITSGEFTETGTRLARLTSAGEVEGHQVVANRATCSPGQDEYCRQAFGIPDLDAYFTVTVPAGEDGAGIATIAAIRDSLAVLPDGQTTVPFTTYPTGREGSEAAFVGALEAAGFTVEVKREECPPNADCVFGVTGIRPEAGTVVPVGSTVTVTVLEE